MESQNTGQHRSSRRLALVSVNLILFYVLPFFYLSRQLLELTGGALWFPPAWRNSVGLLVIVIGGCVFVAARDVRNPRAARPEGAGATVGSAPEVRAWRRRFKLMGALTLVFCLSALAAQFEMRHRFVRAHAPGHGALARVLLDDARNAHEIEWSEALAAKFDGLSLPEGQYLETGLHGVTLSLVVPPRAWMPESYGGILDEWAQRYPEAPFTSGATEELSRLLFALQSEPQSRQATSRVIRLFLLLHLLIIVSASVGYGLIHALIGSARERGANLAGDLLAKWST